MFNFSLSGCCKNESLSVVTGTETELNLENYRKSKEEFKEE